MNVVPYGLVVAEQKRRHLRRLRAQHARAKLVNAEGSGRAPRPFDYEDAVDFLVGRGLEEYQVRAGSVSLDALDAIADVLRDRLPAGPIVAVHVGNFVGLSLCYFTAMLRSRDPASMVVSIDPGLAHRGVEQPDRHVLDLLARYGLDDRSVVLKAFSLESNVGDDRNVYAGTVEDVIAEYDRRAATENALPALEQLAAGRFDLALLDGNHVGDYLRRELESVGRLLRPGGVVVVDDIDPAGWGELRDAFDDARGNGVFETVVDHGRLGVLARR